MEQHNLYAEFEEHEKGKSWTSGKIQKQLKWLKLTMYCAIIYSVYITPASVTVVQS